MTQDKIDLIKKKSVENGIASLYTEKKSKFILDGGKEGFETALALNTPEEFSKAIEEAESRVGKVVNDDAHIDHYWRARYRVLQLEWMREIMKYVWGGYETYSSRAGIAISYTLAPD